MSCHSTPAEPSSRTELTPFSLPSQDEIASVTSVLREAGHKPVRREGTREGRWALLDYNEIVVHVQHVDERDYYSLDRLWKDCPVVEIEGIESAGRPAAWEGMSPAEDAALPPVEPQRDQGL